MTVRLNPYLAFDGDAREAMTFYHEVLGGELTISTFGEHGASDPAHADGVMHAMLETEAGITLMASDTPPDPTYEHRVGNNISISLSGDDEALLRGCWEKLSFAGDVTMPLEKQMWGDEFGMVTDRFGITWMVNISQPALAH